jgi:subtilisin-like proprotein convertase family protein
MTLALVVVMGVASAAPVTFANPSTITIPDTPLGSGTSIAAPYPSTIEVSGLSNDILDVNLTLKGLSHELSDDVDVLVVGPQGQSVLVMSDVGGVSTSSGVTLTFDDAAINPLPDTRPLATGTYMPTQGTNTSMGAGSNPVPLDFPPPAPPSIPEPYATQLSVFDGTNPNGTWKLYVIDDTGADGGQIANGWSLQISTPPTPRRRGSRTAPSR